jgi:hypothetical protein
MPKKVRIYVALTFLAALATGAVLLGVGSPLEVRDLQAIVVLAILGVSAEALAHSAPSGATESIAYIPYVTMAVLVPSWPSALAIGAASGFGSLLRGSGGLKPIFNFSQASLSAGLAAIAFLLTGGHSLLGVAGVGFSWLMLLAVFAASMAYVLVNTAVVSGVIAVSEDRNFVVVWRTTALRSVLYDVVASPVVYLLSWLYAGWGILGAIAFAAPLLVLREIYKTNRQLERVNHELLELMVKAIEARDPYTSGHSRRVSQYSRIIARAIGIGGAELERISVVALLHDVGKIHEIYAPILRKPEKLSPAEWAVMQTHPIKSSELVATVSHLKDIVAPVRHHHENWDGTGYPDGLQGEQIPLGARIVLFADTIDAMTTDRPYRKALSEAQVRSELVKFRGKQFDPEMCDKLLASPMFGLLFAPHARESTPEHNIPVASSGNRGGAPSLRTAR